MKMFLSFGRKNACTKKSESPVETPKTGSSPGTSTNASASNAGSRSTVQTTAGPLLSSSRFNSILDASTYANVNSPGFTSRVVNCAVNGSSPSNGNGSTHQSKYSSIGLFPRVQLGQSTLPTLSPRNSQKIGRIPVRGWIAPPALAERSRRHSISVGPSERVGDKAEVLKRSPSFSNPSSNGESGSPSSKFANVDASVVENQEASRKRILSEYLDPSDDAKKRRRKAELPIPNPNHEMYHYRHVRAPAVPSSPPASEIQSQGKRAREKGSPEEQKRQRRKMCSTNNAISSSLSSSRNLLERLTAQKRKSADTSRSSSPLTPYTGKFVKECKAVTDVKAIQCNLDRAPSQMRSEKACQGESTPVSSRAVGFRPNSKEITDLGNARDKSVPVSPQTPKTDYTTKLFRKEVPSHTPRSPLAKPQKQSLWIQPPQADELTCSLLSDDSKLERPERLKSLLACVRGKESKSEESKVVLSTPISGGLARGNSELCKKVSFSLPVTTSLNAGSPNGANLSTALTVTVSSTCTIMTSATVTSVNGVPSSESGKSPPPLPVPLSTTPALRPPSQMATSTNPSESKLTTLLSSGVNQGKTLPSPKSSAVTCSVSSGYQPVLPSLPEISSSNPSSSLNTSVKETLAPVESSPKISNLGSLSQPDSVAPRTQVSTLQNGLSAPSSSIFSIKSPVNSTQTSQVGTGAASSPQATSQFGAGSNKSAASTTFQFGANMQTSSTSVSSAPLLGAASPSLATAQFGASSQKSATPTTFQFGSTIQPTSTSAPFMQPSAATSSTSSGSTFSAQQFSFGASGSSSGDARTLFQSSTTQPQSVPATMPSAPSFGSTAASQSQAAPSSFQFGSSGKSGFNSSESPSPSLQFGSSNGTSSAPKPAFQFASNGSSSSETTKPAFQFRPSGTPTQVPSVDPKPMFQFGPNTNQNSTNPQFGSSGSNINGMSKTAISNFQFGSSTKGPSDTPKSGFSFGSSSSVNPKSTNLFASTPGDMNGTPKSALQFGSSIIGSSGSSNAAPQFGASTINSSPAQKSTFQFGSSVNGAGASESTKSPFQFSSSMTKPVDSSKPTFQFSSSSDNKASVTSPIQNSVSVFGQTAQQFKKETFTFGSSSSTNSTENKNVFKFQSPSSTATVSTFNFGSGPGSSAFGAPSNSTQAGGPSFGSSSDAKQNGFPSANNLTVSSPGAFSFGASGPSSGGSAFQFNPAANTSSNGGPFSFGQKQQSPAPFSLNATVTAVSNPSSQGAQPGGLFSAGSGSSANLRRVRDARRRR